MSTTDDIRNTPVPAIKEELGGGFYYRCPYKDCGKVVKSDWVACPYCGAMIVCESDAYTEDCFSRKRG